jgi:hypothetical protein
VAAHCIDALAVLNQTGPPLLNREAVCAEQQRPSDMAHSDSVMSSTRRDPYQIHVDRELHAAAGHFTNYFQHPCPSYFWHGMN